MAPLTAEGVEAWYGKVAADPLQWVIEADGHCVSVARLHTLDETNRRARYAIGIFTSAFWNRGIGTDATRLALTYAFEELRLHRVDLRVLAYNERAIACYAKCGFVREGIERDSAMVDGKWESDVMMSILEHEYLEASIRW